MSFSDKFLWGAASAAYQIEGAYYRTSLYLILQSSV
jgi:beta-glucosidase/6-phospho-beta-glucosidase/beta-galactosidase